MKKLILAIISVAIISSTNDVSAEAGTPTFKNCYSLNHKKRETDTKVSLYDPGSSYQVLTGYYQNANGNWIPVYSTYYNLAGWQQKDKDHDGACNKNSAHCKSLTTQTISASNYTAIAEAWNNYSQGTAISQVTPHSYLKAGADENTPAPYESVQGLSSSHAEYDNDIFDDHAIFRLNGGYLEASSKFFTNLKVIVCIRNADGIITDIINESELKISDDGITKTGIFTNIDGLDLAVNSNGNNYLTLPQTGEFNIAIPTQYAENEDVCIYVVTDGGYVNTYVANKNTTQINNEVTIYPNPVIDGTIKIQLSDEFAQANNKIIVTDISGKVIFKTTSINTSLVNLYNLPKGLLFIEIKNEQNTIVKKIISQ
jgi:hypothetical protein